MRKRIFEILDTYREGDLPSALYDWFMIGLIGLSLVPLMFKETTSALAVIEKITVTVFIIDYLLRWATADYKFKQNGPAAFLRYPFSFMAIIDLLSILPALTLLNGSVKLLRLLRMVSSLRVLRGVRYSKSLRIIGRVLRDSWEPLLAVGSLSVVYIGVSALVIFNAEPDSFRNFFEALYWATVSLTTVGYGDIITVTAVGRAIAMVSSLIGIAIVALPSGIITAGYIKAIERERAEEEQAEREEAYAGRH